MIADLMVDVLSVLTTGMEWVESIRFLGVKMVNFEDFGELIFRFFLNIAVLALIVKHIYLKYSSYRNFTFSYLAIGGIVFLLCLMLNNIKLEMGFALGLFAIFGIIRYRTDTIPFKQMTYLFVVIGISVMNALTTKKVSYAEIVFTNCAVFFGLLLLEKYLSKGNEGSMCIVYDNISNINTDRYDVLLEDLKKRTGFDISHFEIVKIDYLKDVANIIIYFHTEDNQYKIDK